MGINLNKIINSTKIMNWKRNKKEISQRFVNNLINVLFDANVFLRNSLGNTKCAYSKRKV